MTDETPPPTLSVEAVAAIAAQSSTEDVVSSLVEPNLTGIPATASDWKVQFIKLDEKWTNDSSGKQSGTYLCVCRHCNGKIPFTGRYCRNHLKICSKYLNGTPHVAPVAPASKRKASSKSQGKAAKRLNHGLPKGQEKFIETLSCVGHDHAMVLGILCQTLRCDFVVPPDIPQATRSVFREAQMHLVNQLQIRVSEGYSLGCRILPGETVFTLHQAGDAATLELLSILETDGVRVARSIEEYLQAKSLRFVTLPESRARRILSARHPDILWIPCMARHLTLLMRDMLSKSGCSDLSALSVNLLADTREHYGCHVATMPLDSKDWGSLQRWLASMLQARKAYDVHIDWEVIASTERLLRPLCWAKYYLEEHPSLSNVLCVLLSMNRYWASLEEKISTEFSACVDHLWLTLEQPLYFLAFALDPRYSKVAKQILDDSLERHGSWRAKQNPLTLFRLMQATEFYHAKFRLPGSASTLVADLQLWMNHDLQKLSMIEFRSSDMPVDYWIRNKAEIPELSSFAVFLLGAQAVAVIPENSSYHNSVISLKVHQQMKIRVKQGRTITNPRELCHAQPIDSNAQEHFQNEIHQGDSFRHLSKKMESVFDGREVGVKLTGREDVAETEDGPELPKDILEPMPDFEIGIAEETIGYFCSKSYCRNDKYTLHRLRCEQLRLPSALAHFESTGTEDL